MNHVLEAAAELDHVLQARGWRYCFIGGIALLRWGKPRETVDADVIVMTGFGNEQPALDLLLAHFEPRIGDAASFALENRVLLLRSRAGVGLDISLGAVAYEELAVRRASDFPFTEAITLKTCSAEDLIVMKAFAGRGQDWVDVEQVILVQRARLDWHYILTELEPLAHIKGDPNILDQLHHLRSKLGG